MIILKLSKNNFAQIIEIMVRAVKDGQVVVCPTDTVYGLVCDADNKKAIAKIFKIKKRSWQKSLSLFVQDIKMAKKAAKIDKKQERFLKKVWPGKTIAILEANPSARLIVRGIVSESGKIGLRIPNYRVISHLLSVIGSPLAQTSANVSDKPPAGKIEDILKQFQGQKHLPDLIINAGKLKSVKPSQVIDLTSKKPKIIRD